MRTLRGWILIALLGVPAMADTNEGRAGGGAKKGRAEAGEGLPVITAAREAAVMAFVRLHHPELAGLLLYLKDHREKDYQRAVRDLFRTSERLAKVQERDAPRYELELKLWKVQSRIQLLAAQAKTKGDESARSKMIELLSEQVDLRKAIWKREREKLAERLRKLDEHLEALETDRQASVERQATLLLGSTKAKPAATIEVTAQNTKKVKIKSNPKASHPKKNSPVKPANPRKDSEAKTPSF